MCIPSSTKRPPSPKRNQVTERSKTWSECAICWKKTPRETTSEAAIARMPISWPLRGSRLPKKTMRKKASRGKTGISQATDLNLLPLHQAHFVDRYRRPVAEDEEHDGEPDAAGGSRARAAERG